MSQPAYKRILLKISGEVLAGEQSFGIDSRMIDYISSEIAEVAAMGVEVAVVIGGGNIFRGLDAADGGMERASADYMGMLATMLNALALQNALEKRDAVTRVQSAIEMRQLAEGYIRRRDRKSTRLNSSHGYISYAVFCLKKKRMFRELDLL